MPEPDSRSTSAKNSVEAAAYEHSVHNAVFEELQQRIRQGDWLPGERMPSIKQLAKELHVGTGSMREALRSLQSIGLVKIEHGRGVYIIGARPSTELSSHFENVGTGLRMALAETRCVLEPELAALAAERGTDKELIEIEALAQRMEKEAQLGDDFAELDVLFHHQIAHAARNPILYQIMKGVSDLFLESRRAILLDPNALLRALRYHALISEALKSRNAPQARLLMQGHMNSMLGEVLASEARKQSTETQNETPKEIP
jgi:GntR family transcriptional repressor for pyruvate dehydrogenase complex